GGHARVPGFAAPGSGALRRSRQDSRSAGRRPAQDRADTDDPSLAEPWPALLRGQEASVPGVPSEVALSLARKDQDPAQDSLTGLLLSFTVWRCAKLVRLDAYLEPSRGS